MPELSEGFIYFLEVDRANSDPRDYNRLRFLNRNILAVIRDDDGMIEWCPQMAYYGTPGFMGGRG